MKPHRVLAPPFVVAIALLLGCGSSADGPPPPEGQAIASPNAPMGSPTAALAFTPDGSPTGRGISAAQAQLRQRPNDLRAHLDLAILFMRHQRETADASLMRYAEDVLASARSLAPADAPAFIVAQLLGAFAATALFLWLIPTLPKQAENVILPHSDTP